jgi:hypothetical protein
MQVLKDINYIELAESVDIQNQQKENLFEVIHRDAQFLAENNLMDYSLLLIKARNPDFNKSSNDSKEEHKLLRMPAIVYVRQKQGPNMLVLRETDNLNIDFKRFGRISGKPLTIL